MHGMGEGCDHQSGEEKKKKQLFINLHLGYEATVEEGGMD